MRPPLDSGAVVAQAAAAASGGNAIALLVFCALLAVAIRSLSKAFAVVNRINAIIVEFRQRRREALVPAMVAAFLIGSSIVLVLATVSSGG